MPMFNGLKPLSAKIIGVALALVFFIFGTSYAKGSKLLDYGKVIIMVTLALVLAIEVGIKKYTNISALKTLGVVQWISVGSVIVLIIAAITTVPFVPIDTPSFVVSITDFVIAIASIMVGVEAVI